MDQSGELEREELVKWSEKIEKQYIEKDVAEWVCFLLIASTADKIIFSVSIL